MINHARLDDALAVYRLFKESRNSLAHEGGVATDRVEQWGIDVSSRAADLLASAHGSTIAPPQFVQGDAVSIGFAQMRAFVALLLNIVFTIDAAILTSTTGEAEFLRRWRIKYGSGAVKVSRKKLNRGNWVRMRFAELGLPVPPTQTDIISYLISNNLVREIP